MKIVSTIPEMRSRSREARLRASTIGLVPTMGALHEGHLLLVRAARSKSDLVVASIFVNPTQFGPNEDYARYPRNLQEDCALFEREGVDMVFAPSVEEMYPAADDATWIVVEGMNNRLCGRSRPGHFRGVTTVVAKLFHIVEPDLAFFGQKDAAQAAIIRRMVRDLNMPVTIEVCPIVREADGLALSSRNAYLDTHQRQAALTLYRSLMRAREIFDQGEREAAKLMAAAKTELAREPAVRLDYWEIVDPNTLEPEPTIRKQALAAVAAFVGNTRLIDNILLEP